MNVSQKIKKVLGFLISNIGYVLVSKKYLETISEDRKNQLSSRSALIFDIFCTNSEFTERFINNSPSQLNQDLFVFSHLGFLRGGYFIEFGAADGISFSNTLILEKYCGWTGIVAEPGRKWHAALKENRACAVETDCVWSSSGQQLTFLECAEGEYSTLEGFEAADMHSNTRQHNQSYQVNTISLLDMLQKHNAPHRIDYLSIDTEGTEFEILNSFDFTMYDIRIITCEHNYTPMREKIYELLTSKGYQRKWTSLSRFDDWYVKV